MLIEQISTRPTAEVNGILGGYTGEGAKTVIPGKAMAKVSFRLVGAQDPDKIRTAFREFVRARVPADCSVEFGNFTSAPAFDVAFRQSARSTKARAALADEWGKKAVTVGAGGSIPIVGDFKTVLGMDTLMVGFALDDDRVHSPNEKYDLTVLPQRHPQLGADFGGAGGVTKNEREEIMRLAFLVDRGLCRDAWFAASFGRGRRPALHPRLRRHCRLPISRAGRPASMSACRSSYPTTAISSITRRAGSCGTPVLPMRSPRRRTASKVATAVY